MKTLSTALAIVLATGVASTAPTFAPAQTKAQTITKRVEALRSTPEITFPEDMWSSIMRGHEMKLKPTPVQRDILNAHVESLCGSLAEFAGKEVVNRDEGWSLAETTALLDETELRIAMKAGDQSPKDARAVAKQIALRKQIVAVVHGWKADVLIAIDPEFAAEIVRNRANDSCNAKLAFT